MTDPGTWANNKTRWIQELATFPSTWCQITFYPMSFLRKIARKNGTRASAGITTPILFWTINTLGALALAGWGDGLVSEQPWRGWEIAVLNGASPLAKVAAGTAVLWLTTTAVFRNWSKERRWLVAKVLCYASVYYAPIAMFRLWAEASASWRLLQLFQPYFGGTGDLASRQPFTWQFGAAMSGYALATVLWLVFVTRGLAMIDNRPMRRGHYLLRVMGAISVLVFANVCFAALSFAQTAVPMWQIARSAQDIDRPPSLDNLTGYQKLESVSRRVSRNPQFTVNDRYVMLRTAIVASVATSEALKGSSPNADSFAWELRRRRREPDQFEESLVAWIKARRWSEFEDRIGRGAQWVNDLRDIRALRNQPGFHPGEERGLHVGTIMEFPLAVWPSTEKPRRRYTVWVTEQRGAGQIGNQWSTNIDIWKGWR